MAENDFQVTAGPHQARLAQAISNIIYVSDTASPLELDEICCIVTAVAADYARIKYGRDYMEKLASVIRARADMPLPQGAANG